MTRPTLTLAQYAIQIDRALCDDHEYIMPTEDSDLGSAQILGIRQRMISQVTAEWDEGARGVGIYAPLVLTDVTLTEGDGYTVTGTVHIDTARVTTSVVSYIQATIYDVGGMSGQFSLTDLSDDELAAERAAQDEEAGA